MGTRVGSEREGHAVQQADQPVALRRVTPLANSASVAPRLARGLSATFGRSVASRRQSRREPHMTWALCLNCGEVKFGAICRCPKCQVESTGDFRLDIAFSDRCMEQQSLHELGAVVAAIRAASSDRELCNSAFIRYISTKHPSVLRADLDPELEHRCDQFLQHVRLPAVTIRPLPRREWEARGGTGGRRWWQFWKRTVHGQQRTAEQTDPADRNGPNGVGS